MKPPLLYLHQQKAASLLKNGSILCGGVGTGKSRTALYYYWDRVLGRKSSGPSLYIITTARKRDTKDWEKEVNSFGIDLRPHVDSWNNIGKYRSVSGSFFIFDEQRVVGYGAWSKSFITITKANQWILLTATPGDSWMDYISVFIANGYYRNKTDFARKHVVYSRFSKYPKVDRFVGTGILIKQRNDILVNMPFEKKTVPHDVTVYAPFDKEKMKYVLSSRWNIYKDEPIKDAGGLCYILRRVVNEDARRIHEVEKILRQHPKAIIFYNFNYELYALREMVSRMDGFDVGEWNGHIHQPVPESDRWVYLVQYTAGAEGWNCTETDTMIFYSQNYSYKIMAQAAGRIDRLNTPFTDLYYYHLCSHSGIDLAIRKAIREKKIFNEAAFGEAFSKGGDAK